LCFGVFGESATAQSTAYPNAPPVTETRVNAAVKDVASAVARNDKDAIAAAIGAVWNDLILYTFAHAVARDNTTVTIRNLTVYRYLGETARTDKQDGAVPNGAGSTSLVERAGLTTFLSYAIEHGAIQESVSGSTVTLKGSPYALFTLANGGDTPENYENFSLWRRFNASASFNVENPTQPLQSINEKQLANYSVTAGLYGDRSTRSKRFQRLWKQKYDPAIVRRLGVLSEGESKVFNDLLASDPGLFQRLRAAKSGLEQDVVAYCKSKTELTDADKQVLAGMYLHVLYETIYDPIRTPDAFRKLNISAGVIDYLNNTVVPSLISAHEALEQAQKDLEADLAGFNKQPLLTLEFTNQRKAMASGYSEFKLLFDGKVAPLDITANAGISFYNRPNSSLHQSKTRHFFGSLELQGSSKNPFRVNLKDLSKVTYSVSARLEHMKETRTNVAAVQIKVEIPIVTALTLPFSVSYANRTELIKEKEVKGHFGLTLDLDKLYAITRNVDKQ
jgi:hypothetical protein